MSVMTEEELRMYREGFADALRWVLRLDELDEDAKKRIREVLNS